MDEIKGLTKAERLLLDFLKKYISEDGDCAVPLNELLLCYSEVYQVRLEAMMVYRESFIKKGLFTVDHKVNFKGNLKPFRNTYDFLNKALGTSINPRQKYFEVYAAFDDESDLLYIGSGKKNRHRHCNSGRSHCLELNKMFFSGEDIIVKVVAKFLTKEEAEDYEIELIQTHKPKYNKLLYSV